ncbi:MAG TPA: methionine--tRNA ligase [Candidatus Paceibacterota bacterium]|nr:methionine--tRNA ligase [Candidatus Paceibacterota bacterium]
MKKSLYITTTLPYVNADPHVGFAMEAVQTDAIARYHRLHGAEVFFNTGTDEHGQKIFQKAKGENRDVVEYVDYYAGQFRKLKALLNLSNDRFIRTTDPDHIAAAQELWRRCLAAGDIYKKKYKGLYCVSDEMFVKEADLVNGRCPNHPTLDLVEIEEENYHFRLSAYQDKLLEYLSHDGVILPEWRRLEAINFVKGGLEDFSISREKSRMSWGVPVPDDDSQVMYVWFDALTNYISTLGWPDDKEGKFKKFWIDGEVVQTAGKDQVRFQSIMWQAMLMSAKIKPTDKVVYHGFINSGGQKMSKSIGNVLDPYQIVEMFRPVAGECATDVLRYYLLRHVNTFDDSDMTEETIRDAYQANLANGLGNLVSRVMTMASINEIKTRQVVLDWFDSHKTFQDQDQLMNNFEFDKAMNAIWSKISLCDHLIQTEEPFKLLKVDFGKAKITIEALLQYLVEITIKLRPFMPITAQKIEALIKENKKPEAPLFARL